MGDAQKKGKGSPLEGIRVLEIAQWAAAPGAAAILGDFGADVIKVEHPVRGDGWRGVVSTGAVPVKDVNFPWEQDNRSKRGITLDVSKPEGQKVVHRLVAQCDVLLTNLRPNEIERYNLAYETVSAINPKLIYANVTGYGRKGDESGRPGYDFSAFWARSGFQAVVREPDRPPVFQRGAMGDHIASVAAACGIVLALFSRVSTGEGQEVDVSLLGTGIWVLGMDLMCALTTGQYPAVRKRSEMFSTFNTYPTKDGKWMMVIHMQPDVYWPAFCKALGLDHLATHPEYTNLFARFAHEAELVPMVEEIMLTKTQAEWKTIFDQHGLIYAPVQDPVEVINDPQAWANDCFLPFDHPIHGPMHWVNSPVRLSKTPAAVRRAAPEFNQHTEEVLLEMGFTWDDITKLKDAGIIA